MHACAWCRRVIRDQHALVTVEGVGYRLHVLDCLARWWEVQRALGYPLPGEPLWRPRKRGRTDGTG